MTRLRAKGTAKPHGVDETTKVALDFAPAFVGEQLRPLPPAGVDFEAMQADTDEELACCALDADVLVSTRTRIYVTELDDLVALARSRVTRSLETEECAKYSHQEQCPE